jgi:hypothetical protein
MRRSLRGVQSAKRRAELNALRPSAAEPLDAESDRPVNRGDHDLFQGLPARLGPTPHQPDGLSDTAMRLDVTHDLSMDLNTNCNKAQRDFR